MTITYKTLREFHHGSLRKQVPVGALLEYNPQDKTVKYNGESYTGFVPEALLSNKYIEVTTTPPTVYNTEQPPPHEKPKLTPIAWVSHKWDTSFNGTIELGYGRRTCTHCGVTEDTSATLTDKTALKYIYTDAYGVSIHTMEPLPCPTFLGHVGGATAANKQSIKAVTANVLETKETVNKIDQRVLSVEDRILALEEENKALHQALLERDTMLKDVLLALKEVKQIAHNPMTNKPVWDSEDAIEVEAEVLYEET